ncbi:MAG: hypothetical protein K0R57_4903 [Paenibacillaceae bacterium]|nr:hypothetical protein [Paenibacillaceae bacterium]
MKRWKKVSLLTLLMSGCFAAGAWATNGIEKVEAFLRPDFKMVVDGKSVQLENPVLLYNDNSYLPVRAISEILGAEVNWDGRTNTIYVNPRFAGQPETPAADDTYINIEMKNPTAYQLRYLGKDYGILSLVHDGVYYYRVLDLARMGVDTRGLKKAREINTHSLYVRQDEVEKLWKEPPEQFMSYGVATSGVPEGEVKDYLLNMANDVITYSQTENSIYPRFSRPFFIEAVDGQQDHYFMYSWDATYTLRIFAIHLAKDQQQRWFRDSLHIVDVDYLYNFFKEKNKN